MMYFLEVDRDSVLDLFGFRLKQKPSHSRDLNSLLDKFSKNSDAIAIWKTKPNSKTDLPAVFVVRDDAIDEFLAFTATYVGTYFPVSAFIRVISTSEAHALVNEEKERQPTPQSKIGIIGVIIAEAYLQSKTRQKSLDQLTIQSCLGTLSYPIAQAFLFGIGDKALTEISSRWVSSKRLLGHDIETLNLDPISIENVWAHILASEKLQYLNNLLDINKNLGIDFEILEALFELSPNFQISEKLLEHVTDQLPDALQYVKIMESTKEDRVRAFQEITNQLVNIKSPREPIVQFFVGYLIAKTGGGSMKYLPLADTVSTIWPSAGLWFGYLSALQPDSDVLVVANCLGRRLQRHLLEASDLFGSPISDISYHEFNTLHRDKTREIGFRTEHMNQVMIELFPEIVGRFRTQRDVPETLVARNMPLDEEGIRELDFLLRRAREIVQRIGEKSSQLQLFPEKRSNSNTKKRVK